MQLTIQQAMLKRAELTKTLRNKEVNLKSTKFSTIEYNLEADGTRHNCYDIENFDEEFEIAMNLTEEIHSINRAIAKANSETFIELNNEKYSIQECLSKIDEYRTKVDLIQGVLRYSKETKTRKVDAAGTAPYYKVVEYNYDKAQMQNKLEALNNSILDLELVISKANNSTYIAIK